MTYLLQIHLDNIIELLFNEHLFYEILYLTNSFQTLILSKKQHRKKSLNYEDEFQISEFFQTKIKKF